MLLRSLLINRNRDTISGDLLEEYREIAVPTLGASGARWWYRRQVAGFVWRAMRLPSMIGLAMGAVLGIINIVRLVPEVGIEPTRGVNPTGF